LGGLKLITEWLLGLFGFDEKAKKLANAKNWSIGGMIVGAFKEVKKWIVGLFTWGKKAGETAKGGFSLMKIIGDVIQKVWDWFKGLLDIDVKAIAAKIGLPDWITGTTSKEEAADEAAKKIADDKAKAKARLRYELGMRKRAAGEREEDIASLREDIAKEKSELAGGDVKGGMWGRQYKREDRIKESNEQLKKLIAQNEKAKALDIEFKKKATTKTKESSIFTHDQGLHDRLDGLTEQMFKPTLGIAISDKSIKDLVEAIAGGGGGGTIVDASTMNVSPSTSTTIGQANAPRQRIVVNG